MSAAAQCGRRHLRKDVGSLDAHWRSWLSAPGQAPPG